MQTVVAQIDPANPDPAVLDVGAEMIAAGQLVAFPTETVYGLGANALDAAAVARIFEAKGRSATNPVIVHVASIEKAKELTRVWTDEAQRLALRFWPGPLTLVVAKRPAVPDIVTAGGATVGLRVPAHPVALALLHRCGLPIAAPSANRSTQVSPTTAAHVLKALGGRIPLIVDAGPTQGGLESTVIDATRDPPRLLRPGLVTVEEIERVLGKPIEKDFRPGENRECVARSPGLETRHYSPSVPLECVNQPACVRVAELLGRGIRVGWLALEGEASIDHAKLMKISLPVDAVGYAARLYAALHLLDDAGVEQIVVTRPPEVDGWRAIHDRLRRAAAS